MLAMNKGLKRSIIVLLLVIAGTTAGISQIRIGIRGGINSTKVFADLLENDQYKIEFSENARLGFHAGLISQVEVWNLFLQPELLFSSVRNDILIEDVVTGKEDLTELILSKIDIPVLLGYKWKVLKLEVGPVGTILINDKSELTDITGYDLLLKQASIGFQAGIGLDVSKLALDFKYEGSLSELGKGITVAGEDFTFDSRGRQLIFSVGLFF
jgi:hypothetical protein